MERLAERVRHLASNGFAADEDGKYVGVERMFLHQIADALEGRPTASTWAEDAGHAPVADLVKRAREDVEKLRKVGGNVGAILDADFVDRLEQLAAAAVEKE